MGAFPDFSLPLRLEYADPATGVTSGWRVALQEEPSPPGPPTFSDDPRPEGEGYVRYEDVYVAGDTLQQTVNRVTGDNVLTFPEGLFLLSNDWAEGNGEGLRICHPQWGYGCRGIAGSGRNTIFTMRKAKGQRLTTGNNPYQLMGAYPKSAERRGRVEFSNFQLVGRALGDNGDMDYSGLMLRYCDDATVDNLYVTGITGSDGVPPFETQAIGGIRCDGLTFSRCEVDGRRLGEPVSADSFNGADCTDVTVSACYAHHNRAAMVGGAWWWCDNVTVIDTYTSDACTPPNKGYAWNHEQCGNVTYIRSHLEADASGGFHLSLNSDKNSRPTREAPQTNLRVEDCTWSPINGDDRLTIQTWRIPGQVQTVAPTVVDAAGAAVPYRWIR